MLIKNNFFNIIMLMVIFVDVFTFADDNKCSLGLYFNTGSHVNSDLMKKIKDIFGVNVFFETGTFLGETAAIALSEEFEKVYTVELGKNLFEIATNKLCSFNNVICYLGNSVDCFQENLKKINGKILFWLDAHYSAGSTDSIRMFRVFSVIMVS